MVTANQKRFFFAHYGLTNRDLETYLAAALSAGGDYADLYAARTDALVAASRWGRPRQASSLHVIRNTL